MLNNDILEIWNKSIIQNNFSLLFKIVKEHFSFLKIILLHKLVLNHLFFCTQ